MRAGSAFLIAVALASVAACGGSESSTPATTAAATTTVATSTTTPTTTTTTSTSTTTVTTTTDVTTSTSTTSTTTIAPSTTVDPTTTEPPADATTVPPVVPGEPPATAFASLGSDLVEVDVATGAVVRTVLEFFEDGGLFRGGLRIDPSGSFAWFSEGYEDGWYSCDTSVGNYGRLDLTSGAIEIVGPGTGPEVSSDGAFVAVVSSGQCLPDPQQPDIWVLTPYDRAVVRNVATGEEREFVTSPSPETYDAPSSVVWAGFTPAGTLLVLTQDGEVRTVDPDGSGQLVDHPVVLTGVEGYPVAATADALLTVVIGDEGSATLSSIDVASGSVTTLASSEQWFTVGYDDDSGSLLVAGFAEIEVVDEAVTVLPTADDEYVGTLDW